MKVFTQHPYSLIRKAILVLSILVFGYHPSYGQIYWNHAYGGSNSEVANAAQQTPDGGYVFAGWTLSNDSDVQGNNGSYDVWVVKTDYQGKIMWAKTFGGSSDDAANDIQLTSDGGYIITGYSYSGDGDIKSGNHGYQDVLIIKLNSTGSLSWEKTYGGSDNDIGYGVQQTGDGGYIIGATTFSNNGDININHGSTDMWLIKLDASGNKSWAKTYGGTGADAAYAISTTDDGGFVLAGATKSLDGDVTGYHNSGFGSDYWIAKTDASGTLLWQKTLGGTLDEEAHSIRQTSDEGFIIAGYSYSNDGDVSGNHGNQDMWIVNLDATGSNVTWQKCLGGSQQEIANSVKQTSDGNYIVAGATMSSDGQVTNYHQGWDYWLAKLNLNGDLIWERALGGANDDIAHCVQQTLDGGYIVAGESKSDDGDVIKNNGLNDFWVVKTGLSLSVQPLDNGGKNIQVYPTITDNALHVVLPKGAEQAEIRIVNTLGKTIVFSGDKTGLDRQLHVTNTAAGMYLLQVIDGSSINNFRIIYKP